MDNDNDDYDNDDNDNDNDDVNDDDDNELRCYRFSLNSDRCVVENGTRQPFEGKK